MRRWVAVSDVVVGVIGLGYVGLPLAVEFAKRFKTIGFDVDEHRVDELARGHDRTLEVPEPVLRGASELSFTSSADDLGPVDIMIVTVPTPIDRHKRPDLRPLEAASQTAGRQLAPGNTVVYESTVFPGATEDVCVPILERESGLTVNEDFWAGYSPERINPGDQSHRLPDIAKITSGSCPEAAEFIDDLYRRIIRAGTHRAPSIRVAEAAKVIENTQRDVNIALMNELAVLFAKLGLDTSEVLAAAGTKWNFLPFKPGLVGGHCIGVDPYYLTHKAAEVGHHPDVILAGRRINDSMGTYVGDRVAMLLARRGRLSDSPRALVLGLTFKPNVPDLRNTRVADTVRRLQEYGIATDVCDPLADPAEAEAVLDIRLVPHDSLRMHYDAAVFAVGHSALLANPSTFSAILANAGVVFDVTGLLDPEKVTARL